MRKRLREQMLKSILLRAQADVTAAPAEELFLGVFYQWALQLFQERKAQTRGGLMKSDREMRRWGVSDPDHVQISSALVVSLPANSNLCSLTNSWVLQ